MTNGYSYYTAYNRFTGEIVQCTSRQALNRLVNYITNSDRDYYRPQGHHAWIFRQDFTKGL